MVVAPISIGSLSAETVWNIVFLTSSRSHSFQRSKKLVPNRSNEQMRFVMAPEKPILSVSSSRPREENSRQYVAYRSMFDVPDAGNRLMNVRPSNIGRAPS